VLEPKENENDEKYYGVGIFILELLKVFFLAFIIIIPIRVFLFQPFFVQGASMEPNFEDNQYLIVNEFGYKDTRIGSDEDPFVSINSFKNLKRGETAVFRYPKNRNQFFIKRVIGLPGEKIEIKDNKVKIFNSENPDGFVLDESSYLRNSIKTFGDMIIPLKEDEYFVLGDNRMFSSDSRSWGAVNKKDIVGKVLLRAWPLDNLKVF
jgi:signal peptidase I